MVRRLLRTGSADALRCARHPVLEATQRLERWIYRNLPWSAGVGLGVIINSRWLTQHQVPAGTVWGLVTMALGVVVQVTWQLWFLNRARYIRRICGAS